MPRGRAGPAGPAATPNPRPNSSARPAVAPYRLRPANSTPAPASTHTLPTIMYQLCSGTRVSPSTCRASPTSADWVRPLSEVRILQPSPKSQTPAMMSSMAMSVFIRGRCPFSRCTPRRARAVAPWPSTARRAGGRSPRPSRGSPPSRAAPREKPHRPPYQSIFRVAHMPTPSRTKSAAVPASSA